MLDASSTGPGLRRSAPAAAASPRLVQHHPSHEQDVVEELLQGLAQPQAQLPSKYFYDTLGSRLFEAITELPEYTLTRSERAIFERHATQMRAHLPDAFTLVDLGAGNCQKAASLLPVLQPACYVAVDISAAFLEQALQSLKARHPDLPMRGLGLDFSRTLALDAREVPSPRVLFYAGSSIGNFSPAQALAFLRRARAQCQGGGLLVGVDLRKPVEQMVAAYDDALRVTSAFNRNILRNVNRHLGSDFDLADWRHVAFFNDGASCVEMHLQALRTAQVHWPGGGRRFAAGERIHTERSHKWRLPEFLELLAVAGFAPEQAWTDDEAGFAVCWARA